MIFTYMGICICMCPGKSEGVREIREVVIYSVYVLIVQQQPQTEKAE